MKCNQCFFLHLKFDFINISLKIIKNISKQLCCHKIWIQVSCIFKDFIERGKKWEIFVQNCFDRIFLGIYFSMILIAVFSLSLSLSISLSLSTFQNISIFVVLICAWRISMNMKKSNELGDVYYGKLLTIISISRHSNGYERWFKTKVNRVEADCTHLFIQQ